MEQRAAEERDDQRRQRRDRDLERQREAGDLVDAHARKVRDPHVLRVGRIADVLHLDDGHHRRHQRRRREDAQTRQHGIHADADAEGIERTAIQRKRAEQAEERDVAEGVARRNGRDDRRQRRLDAGQARCDQQHADPHEEHDRGRDVLDAADRGGDERRDDRARLGGQRAEERGQREGDDRIETEPAVARDRQERRDERERRRACA
ncbi:MAG: hypothetical protein ACLPYS_18540, partial [Vulcanimicrobiaceae bacterium]